MNSNDRTVEKLLRQQAALAAFGSFAFREPDLQKILTEAARTCAASLGVKFSKICRYRSAENDLLIVAGCGWQPGVVGRVVSQVNEGSPQGRAYVTGHPVILANLREANDLDLPSFYADHGILSTVDVLIPAIDEAAFGVLEVDSQREHEYDEHDINFLTGFANVLAESVAAAERAEVIQALLASKTLMAEELQHRVRNNLQMITSMLDSYARTAAIGPARHDIEMIVRRVTTLAQVYDSLLGVGLSETIDLADYLRELCISLPSLQTSLNKRIQVVFNADSVLLGLDDVTALGMVVAELVTNSYRHAFPDRDGIITITLTRTSPATASLTIRDDGVGFKAELESTRHGVGLARRLMVRVGGTLDLRAGEGSLWTLTFAAPVPPELTRVAA